MVKTVNLSASAPTIDTSQSLFGGASAKFVAASHQYFYLNGESDFAFGTGDFTVETRVRLASKNTIQVLYDSRPVSVNGFYPTIYINSDNTIHYFTNNADKIAGASAVTTGTWYHVLLARSGTSTKLFLDGAQQGSTYTDSNTYVNGASVCPIVGANGFTRTLNSLDGWLQYVQTMKGLARFTANFTPPTLPYLSDGYTTLLLPLCTDFVDIEGVIRKMLTLPASTTTFAQALEGNQT